MANQPEVKQKAKNGQRCCKQEKEDYVVVTEGLELLEHFVFTAEIELISVYCSDLVKKVLTDRRDDE